MKKSLLSVLLLMLLAVVLVACGSDKDKEEEETGGTTNDEKDKPKEEANKGKDTITMVWYPNESGNDMRVSRDEVGGIIEEVTGKKVEHQLTTDYAIAIETIANGKADLAFMGAQGYIEAKNKSDDVVPLVVPSGESGTLDDAVYYSWLAVREADADNYKKDGAFTIDNLVDSKFSFVSNSSTSGFKVPSDSIIGYFSQQDEWKDLNAEMLMEGGKFFKEVMYGESHQGSAVNLLTERADIAAFCDTCVGNYVELAEGNANEAGAIYAVKEGAADPFTKLIGERFQLISSTPVLNAPVAANMASLGEEDFKKIQDALTSDETANNENIFAPESSDITALFKRKADERFVTAEDSWFDPIRQLSN